MDIEKAPKAFRTISEVSEIIGVQPYVIRFWESQFKQIRPTRKKGGRRYYRPSDIAFLGGIKKLLHEEKLTIKKVKSLIIKKGKNNIIELVAKTKVTPYKSENYAIKLHFTHSKIKKEVSLRHVIDDKERKRVSTIINSLRKIRNKIRLRIS